MLKEIRCGGCGKLLGKFDGIAEIKCNRMECRGINRIDTISGIVDFIPQRKPVYLENRKTSSGVTF